MWDPSVIKSPFGHHFRPLKKTQLFCKSSDKSFRKALFSSGDKVCPNSTIFSNATFPFIWESSHFLPRLPIQLCLNETQIVTYGKHRESSQSQAGRKAQWPRRRKTGQHAQHSLDIVTAQCLLSAWQMAWILFRSGIDKLNWERQRGPRRNVSGRFETHQPDSVLLISSLISVRYRAVKYLLLVVVVQLLSHVQLFCDPLDYSPLGSSGHGIPQARILERVVMPSSRGSS